MARWMGGGDVRLTCTTRTLCTRRLARRRRRRRRTRSGDGDRVRRAHDEKGGATEERGDGDVGEVGAKEVEDGVERTVDVVTLADDGTETRPMRVGDASENVELGPLDVYF